MKSDTKYADLKAMYETESGNIYFCVYIATGKDTREYKVTGYKVAMLVDGEITQLPEPLPMYPEKVV